jgi:hypothetical protein
MSLAMPDRVIFITIPAAKTTKCDEMINKLLLLLPILLLSACSGARICDATNKVCFGPTRTASTHSPTRQNESRTSVQATDVLSSVEAAQIATPDANATLQARLIIAQATTFQLERDLIAAEKENRAIDARKAEAEAATARDKLALAKEQNRAPVEVDNAKRALVEAENKRLELAADLARAETEQQQGTAKTAALLSFCAVMIGFILLAYKAMTRPHAIAAPLVEDEADEAEREPEPAPEPSDEYDDLPPGVDDNDMRKFMQYATTGKPLGAESMAAVWGTSPAQRSKRNKIMAHLEHHEHLERYAGAKRLNVTGDIIWRVWLKNNPPTAKSEGINAENTLHGYDLHADTNGGVGDVSND